MKRILTLFAFLTTLAVAAVFVLCAAADGANELRAFAPGMTTVYSVVREADGDVWYVAGQVFEAWGTGGRTAADYDIAMTDKSGDFFVGDFDTNIANGDYIVAVHYQAAAAPADSDAVIWIQEGTWDGATFAASAAADVDEGTIADEVVAHMDANSTDLNAILLDTSAYDTDAEHAAAIWNALIASYGTAGTYGEELEDLDPNVTLILADTGELQTDWHDGGRLDLILDAAGGAGDPWSTALPGAYAAGTAGYLVGTYLDASIADVNTVIRADIADVNATVDVNAIAQAVRAEMDANSVDLDAILADTNELQTDWTNGGRLDLLLDAVKAMTDLIAVVTTTVATPNDVNNFTITAGQDVNDAYWMNAIMVEDATDSHAEVRWITEYVTSRDVTVDEPFSFTPAAADKVWIMGTTYGGLLDTILRSLNVSKVPVYYMDATGGGASEGAGGVTHYQSDGTDP